MQETGRSGREQFIISMFQLLLNLMFTKILHHYVKLHTNLLCDSSVEQHLHEGAYQIVSYNSCTEVYYYFKSSLGKPMLEQEGYTEYAEVRIVDMFTACTHPSVKNIILKQFQQPGSALRVLVETIAFSIGSLE